MGGVFVRVISTNGLPAMLLHALALMTFIIIGIGLLEYSDLLRLPLFAPY